MAADALKTAIAARWAADATLSGVFGPFTDWQQAANQTPVCILVPIEGKRLYTGFKAPAGSRPTTYVEPAIIRFTVFALTEQACDEIVAAICNSFDYSRFAVTNQYMCACRRVSGNPQTHYVPSGKKNSMGTDIACYQGTVTYEFDMQRTIGQS